MSPFASYGHAAALALGSNVPHHRADTGDGHQAPAYLVIPDDSKQAAMQHGELFAQRPSDNQQRFDQVADQGCSPRAP